MALDDETEYYLAKITEHRKYEAFTSRNNKPLLDAIGLLDELDIPLGIEPRAVIIERENCIIIQLFDKDNSYVLVYRCGREFSSILIEHSFPNIGLLVHTLNHLMMTLWIRAKPRPLLTSALLIEFLEVSERASIHLKDDNLSTKLEVNHMFMENALVTVARDDHHLEGPEILLTAVKTKLAPFKLELSHIHQVRLSNRLKINDKGIVRVNDSNDAFRLTSVLINVCELIESAG